MKTSLACSSVPKKRSRPPKPKPAEAAPKRPRGRPKKAIQGNQDRVQWLQGLHKKWKLKRSMRDGNA